MKQSRKIGEVVVGIHYFCCHECDEICSISTDYGKGRYKCPNCGHTLFKNNPAMIERIYAMSLSALILFIVANSFPVISLGILGKSSSSSILTSVSYLYQDGDYILATAVFMTIFLIPLFYILLTLFISFSIYHGRIKRDILIFTLRLLEEMKPWGMLDVFLVGTLVSIVKLIHMGDIVPGPSLWALVFLIPALAYNHMIYDPHILWKSIEDIEPTISGNGG